MLVAEGHKIPQGWKSTHKFVGAFMRDLQRAEDTPPLTLGNSKTIRDLRKRAENIIAKVSEAPTACSCSITEPARAFLKSHADGHALVRCSVAWKEYHWNANRQR